MTATPIVCGWIVQHQEDHPHNPGWWRFARPCWVATDDELPMFSESVRCTWGTREELAEAQSEWDRSNPKG
jgi:hypothetical protein